MALAPTCFFHANSLVGQKTSEVLLCSENAQILVVIPMVLVVPVGGLPDTVLRRLSDAFGLLSLPYINTTTTKRCPSYSTYILSPFLFSGYS